MSASRNFEFKTLVRTLYGLAVMVATFGVSAAHAEYSRLVVFGDSLSDNGNLFRATGSPGAPYQGGRFSNGPVALETTAAKLGVPLNDFAWGGATTGPGNTADGGTATQLGARSLPGVATQVSNYLNATSSALDPRALYVVWAGPNDFLSGLAGYATNPAAGAAAIGLAVSNLVDATGRLAQQGALNFLIPVMPDLGITTRAFAGGPASVAAANQFTQLFHGALAAAMRQLDSAIPGSITLFDTYAASRDIYNNAALYGITNKTEPCFNASMGSVCANPDQYYFWDDIHPTAKVHANIGERIELALVPEPESWALLMIGLGALGWRARSRHASSR